MRHILFPQWSTSVTLVGHVVVHYAENQKDAIHVKLSQVSLVLCHNFFFFLTQYSLSPNSYILNYILYVLIR